MIRIYNSKTNKRKHTTIKKILHKALLQYKNLLPNFRIIIYDKDLRTNRTSIFKNRNRIDFNVRQLLRLYHNPGELIRDKKDHIGIIKTFKQYIIFVLYHELGHFKSRDYFNNRYGRAVEELRADYFSLKILKKLKVIK